MSDTLLSQTRAELDETKRQLASIRDMLHSATAERDAAKAALSGRTVSCSNCNELAAENAEMRDSMKIIYDAAECCADGAPDASDHDKLCNELTHILKSFIK